MKYLAILVIVALVFASTVFCSSESVKLVKRQAVACQNSGQYNPNTLRCDCFPSFAGNDCSQLLCNKTDPVSCGTYVVSYCSVKQISDYCPRLCNRCNCFPLNCLNGGIFSNVTCACNCFSTYSGSRCETLNCNIADPPSCRSYSTSYCSASQIASYCPTLCGRCGGTTPAPVVVTTPPVCLQTLQCQNYGIFNNRTCRCDCIIFFFLLKLLFKKINTLNRRFSKLYWPVL
jgi:hypothetical protein